MKNIIIKSFLLAILCAGVTFGQGYFAKATKELDKNKNYDAAFKLAEEAYQKDSISAAQFILLYLKDKKQNVKLLDLLAKVWEKMSVPVNAISNYEEADKLDSNNVERKYIIADLYFKEGRITDAANLYLKIVNKAPDSKDAYFKLADIFSKASPRMPADAAHWLEQSLKFDDGKENYKKCIKFYNEANNFQKSYEISLKALEKYNNDVEFRKNAWISAIRLKKYEDALNQVVNIPDSLLSGADVKNAGMIAEVLKKDDLMTKYYNLAAEKNPDDKDLYVKLAVGAFNSGEYDKAIEYYNKQLAIDPKHPDALKFKAYAYYKKGDYNDARGALLDWLAVSDTSVTDYLYLSICYDKLDSNSKKYEIYNKVLKMTEGREKLYKDQIFNIYVSYLARYNDNKDWNNTIAYGKRVLSFKEDFNTLVLVGAAYFNLKDYDNSLVYYRRAQKINPNHEAVKKGLRMLSAD